MYVSKRENGDDRLRKKWPGPRCTGVKGVRLSGARVCGADSKRGKKGTSRLGAFPERGKSAEHC